jgi:hypothetical protein
VSSRSNGGDIMAVNRRCLLRALKAVESDTITPTKLKQLSKECATNPGRPTREFWSEVYPQVREYYGSRYPHDPKRAERLARETVGSIWHHKTRRKAEFERIRRGREE